VSLKLKGKFHDTWFGLPIEIEWELNQAQLEDLDAFAKIAAEIRRIAYQLAVQDQRYTRRWRNLRLQNSAIQNIRHLFKQEAGT